MVFVDKQPSRMQGQIFFFKFGGASNVFRLGSKTKMNSLSRLPKDCASRVPCLIPT